MLKSLCVEEDQSVKTKTVVDFFGSKKKVASALGITPSAVTMWGVDVPELRQYQLERQTSGALKADKKKSVA